MGRSLGTWVGENYGKRRPTGGRAGAIVQQSLKGTTAEMLVISLLHLSLEKPVLKTFNRVKVSKRVLQPFRGTATCDLTQLQRKFVDVMAKFGVRRNAQGRPIRCTAKVKATPASKAAKAARQPLLPVVADKDLVTPTKQTVLKTGNCFSGAKVAEATGRGGRSSLRTRSLQVVFNSALDVKDDNATYCAAMAKHRLNVCDWKPVGQPHIVDAEGIVYKGKPKRLDAVTFPLTVAMTLTKR
eukprot:gb/GFBE01079663.1/.p1 GENE.gb/GFBE01079663.1/~~gb/GFBE01079663.1/.p1  ORF type:complete len:241 (+),score=36.40 gb/GFBE01079663.1/:1-723(+)